jgi:hypothetical protein
MVVLASYALVSWRDRSLMHFLTPSIVLSIPTLYIFPLTDIIESGPFGSIYAFVYFYGTTAAVTLISALVYCFIKPPKIGWDKDRHQVKREHWYCLIASAVVFSPIVIRFASLLATPRAIYQQTRSGEGIYYFTSSFLLVLAFVFFLFNKKKTFISSIVFLVLVVILSLLHGSKGQLLSFFWLWVIFEVYVNRRRFKFWRTVATGTVPVILMAILFIFLQRAAPEDLFFAMARYANYSEVAMMVIDDQTLTPQYGRVTLETAIYSRVPRALFPSKPNKFGPFVLTSRYFPAEEWDDIGSPDFGIGLQYYDFGPFAIIYVCVWSAITAYLSRGLVRRLETSHSRANYALLAFLAGVPFIPIGISYLLPEQLALCCILALHGRVKITLWRR